METLNSSAQLHACIIDKAYWNEEQQVYILRRTCIPDHEYTETSLYRCFRCELSPRSDFYTVPIFGMLPIGKSLQRATLLQKADFNRCLDSLTYDGSSHAVDLYNAVW